MHKEPVWLEPDDVADGIDTVVQAAMEWIIEVGPERTGSALAGSP